MSSITDTDRINFLQTIDCGFGPLHMGDYCHDYEHDPGDTSATLRDLIDEMMEKNHR